MCAIAVWFPRPARYKPVRMGSAADIALSGSAGRIKPCRPIPFMHMLFGLWGIRLGGPIENLSAALFR